MLGLGPDQTHAAIVCGVIALARNLGLVDDARLVPPGPDSTTSVERGAVA